jgi:hypothetical protein
MTFIIRHLNGLIFDCLSFTEGLFTCLSTVESEAPASSNTSVMLILKRIVTKSVFFYVMMTTEIFIQYFCDIKLCCLWRFVDKMSVIYWKIVCAYILVLVLLRVYLPVCPLWRVRRLPPVTPLSHLCGPSMLPCVCSSDEWGMSYKMKKIGILDMSCIVLFYSCDWTESENVNFIRIC